MGVEIYLNEYEKLVRSATEASLNTTIRDIRERKTWSVYRFLVNCGVDKSELEKIERKYNF